MLTFEQDQLLLRGVKYHGTSWKEIQTLHFACRSANNVKNRYTIISRRSMTAPPNAPPCCSHGQLSSNTEPSGDRPAQDKPSDTDIMTSDNDLSHTDAMEGVFSSDLRPLDFGFLHNSATGLESSEDWNQDLLWDPSNPSDFDALLMFSDQTPTPMGADTEYFMASSNRLPPFDLLEGLDSNLSSLNSIEFGANQSQQHPSASSDSNGSDRSHARRMTSQGGESRSSRESISGSSTSQVSCSSADSRYTITIDGAEPDTVMQVMNILVASRAMVNFRSN